jgi:N6-adenosine-specific RNA methylase IME4
MNGLECVPISTTHTSTVAQKPAVDAAGVDNAVAGAARRWHHRKESVGEWLTEHGYPPPHSFNQLFPMPTPAELLALMKSIAQTGLRDAIVMSDGKIADGVARCVALIALGVEWRMVRTKNFTGDKVALRDFIIDTNLTRRNLKESQRAMAAVRLATMGQGARTDLPQYCGMSQGEAAERMNVGIRLLQDAKAIEEQGTQALIDAVNDGIITVSAAVKAIGFNQEMQKQMVTSALVARNPKKAFVAATRNARLAVKHCQVIINARLAESRYPVVLADNAWRGHISYTADPYPRSSIDELCALRIEGQLIRNLIAPDALLVLWILDVHLFNPERPVERILEAWGGFKLHLPCLVWAKPRFSVGTYHRCQHELVVMATRGNFPPPEEALRFSSLIVEREHLQGGGFRFAQPYDGRHSSKPDRLQEMIEQAYPQYFGLETVETPLALELFSRRYRPKWDGWGNDYPGRPPYGVALESWTPTTPAS